MFFETELMCDVLPNIIITCDATSFLFYRVENRVHGSMHGINSVSQVFSRLVHRSLEIQL